MHHDESLAALYPAHLDTLRGRYDDALAACGHDAVLIGAGAQEMRHLDDQAVPFRANPQLLQWLPLDAHPQACLLYRPGQPPLAVVCQAEDFWHAPPPLPGPPWTDALELRIVTSPDRIGGALGPLSGQVALLGPVSQWQALGMGGNINPPALLDHLAYQRAIKTPYEVECVRQATVRAVAGHRAAARALAEGGSEFAVLMAFLASCRQTADELPYPAIVAGDSHGATLHYQHYERRQAIERSLLIDAGCSHLGYAADITRTHARSDSGPFAALLMHMEAGQRALCARVRPGTPFGDLHQAAHLAVAGVLGECGLAQGEPEGLVESGVTRHFFPHGLGHFLGLQVHDVGGHLAGPGGGCLPAPPAWPKLRLLRTLEAGQILTIEPGIYFITSLLRELRAAQAGRVVNWGRVESLQPFGGIRIEDNVLVTPDGAHNLTRDGFAAGG
jgi:Xaa-Pro dipeptidase